MTTTLSPESSRLRDKLLGALIGIARAADGHGVPTPNTWKLVVQGLVLTAGEAAGREELEDMIRTLHQEKAAMLPMCAGCVSPCGHNEDYPFSQLWEAPEEIRGLKTLILTGIQQLALGCPAGKEDSLGPALARALFPLGEDWEPDLLLPTAQWVGNALADR